MTALRTRVTRASLLTRFAVVSLLLVLVLGLGMARLLATMIANRGLASARDAAVVSSTLAVHSGIRLVPDRTSLRDVPETRVASCSRRCPTG